MESIVTDGNARRIFRISGNPVHSIENIRSVHVDSSGIFKIAEASRFTHLRRAQRSEGHLGVDISIDIHINRASESRRQSDKKKNKFERRDFQEEHPYSEARSQDSVALVGSNDPTRAQQTRRQFMPHQGVEPEVVIVGLEEGSGYGELPLKTEFDQYESQMKANKAASELIVGAQAIMRGHFVYKSGKHGPLYIDKLRFGEIGVEHLHTIINAVVDNAVVFGGLDFPEGITVRVVGPAYGAIGYALPVALRLADLFPMTKFVVGFTQLDENGKQSLPQKLVDLYAGTDMFVLIDDIVNSGTTVREVGTLLRRYFGKGITHCLSAVSRGGQKSDGLNVETFNPLIDVIFAQYDPRMPEELAEINELPAIDTILGKGKMWIDLFGPGPYEPGTDFSAFPFE